MMRSSYDLSVTGGNMSRVLFSILLFVRTRVFTFEVEEDFHSKYTPQGSKSQILKDGYRKVVPHR